jgi:hypothetical protein
MKREPRWVTVFLKQLERTGNVRLAAGGAGVDFSTAYQRRKRHADFAEAWESALRLRSARTEEDALPLLDCAEQPPSPIYLGEETVLRPDGKLIKASEARWGKRAEEAFLLELTVSGSVRRAALTAGFSTTAVYKRRLIDKRFAAAWEAAIETGKARVQAYLVEAATRTFDPDELPIGDGDAIPKVSISEAINIAKLKAVGPATDWQEPDLDEDQFKELRERILEKLQRLREREIAEGWTPYPLETPLGRDGSIREVWVPPGYRLIRAEKVDAGGRHEVNS